MGEEEVDEKESDAGELRETVPGGLASPSVRARCRGPLPVRAFRTVLRWTSAAALGTVVLAATVALVCVALAAAREREDPARAAPSTGRFVRGGDVEVFVQEAGPADGPAVVLVHGTGAALIARAWSAAPHDRCYIHPPSMDEATVSTHTSNGSPPI